MKSLAVIFIGLSLVFLTSCTRVSLDQPAQTSYETQTVSQRETGLTKVTAWNASGALSVQPAGQSATIMRYQWRQQGMQRYHIDLSASLNLAAVKIIGKPNRVTLQRGSRAPVVSKSSEQLMKQQLGWSLPVDAFWYWARGLSAPGVPQKTKYDKYGHLVMLKQRGWSLQFSQYRTVKGVDLPQMIQLQYPNLSAKIVIKQWQLL